MAAVLTKKDLSDAQAGIYECRECLKTIEKIKACGLDCQDREDRANHLIRFFEAVRQEFNPAAQSQ